MATADQYVAEIRFFPYTFAPDGWADCNGQLLPINQNTALFSLIGTTYGGNGTSNFALPNLNGVVPIGMGTSTTGTTRMQGETGGVEEVALTLAEMPLHTHQVTGFASAATDNDVGPTRHLAQPKGGNIYGGSGAPVEMAPNMLGVAGGSAAHTNMQPYLTGRYCIAMLGIFPPRS